MILITSALLSLLSGGAFARDLAPDSMTIRDLLIRGGSLRVSRQVKVDPGQGIDRSSHIVVYQRDREIHYTDSGKKRAKRELDPAQTACYVTYSTSKQLPGAKSDPGYRLTIDEGYRLPILNDGVASDADGSPEGRSFTLALRPVKLSRAGTLAVDAEVPFRSVSCRLARNESREPTVGDLRIATRGLFEIDLELTEGRAAEFRKRPQGYETLLQVGHKRLAYNPETTSLRILNDRDEYGRSEVMNTGEALDRAVESLLKKRDRAQASEIASSLRVKIRSLLTGSVDEHAAEHGFGATYDDVGYRYERLN